MIEILSMQYAGDNAPRISWGSGIVIVNSPLYLLLSIGKVVILCSIQDLTFASIAFTTDSIPS